MSIYTTAVTDLTDDSHDVNASEVGTVGTPVSGTLTVRSQIIGGHVVLRFILENVVLDVTDAGVSGSYASLKLFTVNTGHISYHASFQRYTSFSEGSSLTGGAGDASFVIGVGQAAISSAASASFTPTQNDIVGSASATLSGGTAVTGSSTTSTAGAGSPTSGSEIHLNFSGSAASIDASSTITIGSGEIVIIASFTGGAKFAV